MLDYDLAALYGVETKGLNRAAKRNLERFPPDFMFQPTIDEARHSRCQIGTLNRGRNIKYLPFAFTEQGVAMLSGVLRSTRAVQANIAIMRAFVQMRETITLQTKLARRLDELEQRFIGHDHQLEEIFGALRELMDPGPKPIPRIGFKT